MHRSRTRTRASPTYRSVRLLNATPSVTVRRIACLHRVGSAHCPGRRDMGQNVIESAGAAGNRRPISQDRKMAIVASVSRSQDHTFTKPTGTTISLIAGLGVEGDAHM